MTGKLVVITRKRKILKCSFLGVSECKLYPPQLFQVPELVKYNVVLSGYSIVYNKNDLKKLEFKSIIYKCQTFFQLPHHQPLKIAEMGT